MKRLAVLSLMCVAIAAASMAQQGWLPLGRVVDAPYTALMHGSGSGYHMHSAVRPYLREEMSLLPGADTLLPKACSPWLQRITDPAARWHYGPLLDAQAGGSFNEKEVFKYRVGAGGWLEWNAGPKWTLHADLMAWNEALPDYADSLSRRAHVSLGEGFAFRSGTAITHYDWNAWADYKAGKYFHFTLGRGKNFFGEGVRSLFLSDNAGSYPYLRITTTAWRIKYVNLFCAMKDVAGIGSDPSGGTLKFASMHYLSWNALKRLNIGVYEAVMWSNGTPEYPRGFDLNYLNPVVFYRPTEYSVGSPDNALLGFAVNVKVGRRVLLYSQLMLDEFLLTNVRAGKGWFGNKQGLQLGVVAHDAFRVKGLTLRTEVDYVRPFMFTHNDSLQNYAQASQALAHPYGSGFAEFLGQGEWRRGKWLFSYLVSVAIMGQDTDANSYGNNIFLPESARPLGVGTANANFGYYLGEPSKVTIVQNEARAGYTLEGRSGLMLEAACTLRARQPEQGDGLFTAYFRVGIATYLRDRHPFQEARYTLP